MTDSGCEFVASSSLHSEITSFAYGKALSRRCVDISDGKPLFVHAFLHETDIKKRRFFIKLTACLLEWQKYENDLVILVNGISVYENRHTFFENVNLGWCTQYFPCPLLILKDGENEITLQTTNASRGGLLVSVVDLVSLPAFEEYTQISSLRYVRLGNSYAVAVYGGKTWKIKRVENCQFEEILYPDEPQS